MGQTWKTPRSQGPGRVPLAHSPLLPCLPQRPAPGGPCRRRGAAGHLRLQELQPDVLHREGAEQPHVLPQRPVAIASREAGAAGEGHTPRRHWALRVSARLPGIIARVSLSQGGDVFHCGGVGKPGAGWQPAPCRLCLLKTVSSLPVGVWRRVLQANKTGAEARGGWAESPRSPDVPGQHGPLGDTLIGACGSSTPSPGQHGQGGCWSVPFLPQPPACWGKRWGRPRQTPPNICLQKSWVCMFIHSFIHSAPAELPLCPGPHWRFWGPQGDHDTLCPPSWGSQASVVDRPVPRW